MTLHPLESRRLLSATVDSSNILQVAGTSGNDTIILSVNSDGKVVVAVNAQAPEDFSPSTLAGYNIQGLDGHDLIIISPLLSGATVQGGNGNDRIAGGAGNETLYGGAGKDQLDGGG